MSAPPGASSSAPLHLELIIATTTCCTHHSLTCQINLRFLCKFEPQCVYSSCDQPAAHSVRACDRVIGGKAENKDTLLDSKGFRISLPTSLFACKVGFILGKGFL